MFRSKQKVLDKDKVTTVFENQVVVRTKNEIIKSDYVKYNKDKGILILKKNIEAEDDKNNIIYANYAEYYENNKVFKLLVKQKLRHLMNI